MRRFLPILLLAALTTSVAAAQSLGDAARENRSASKQRSKRVYTDDNPLPAADAQPQEEVLPWQPPYSRKQVQDALDRLWKAVAHNQVHIALQPGEDPDFIRMLRDPENLLTSAEWRRTIAEYYRLRKSECKAGVPDRPESELRKAVREKLVRLMSDKNDDSTAATVAVSRAIHAKGMDSPIAEAANRDLWVEAWIHSQMSDEYLLTHRTCEDLDSFVRPARN